MKDLLLYNVQLYSFTVIQSTVVKQHYFFASHILIYISFLFLLIYFMFKGSTACLKNTAITLKISLVKISLTLSLFAYLFEIIHKNLICIYIYMHIYIYIYIHNII